MADAGGPLEEGRPSVIPFGMYRTRMRIRSRTVSNTANGQADTPVQATLIDLVGHVRPNANYREDGIVNFSEGAIDTIEIVIPYYEAILTGYLVEVYDSINNAQAITYYEIMSITDDRNKHQQLSLKCRVAERSILPIPSYSVSLQLVGGGGGGGGTNNNQYGGGGGGAGGMIQTVATLIVGTSYTATIGSGGAGASGTAKGIPGGDTLFTGVTTAFGGGGGGSGANNANKDGGNGGCGGGAGGFGANGLGGTGSQGLNGGNGNIADLAPYRGAGGGGINSAGANGNGASGVGGAGFPLFGVGIEVCCGGGGGGTIGSAVLAGGGLGGGGNGGYSSGGVAQPPTNGSPNTGGGGGGAGGTGSGTGSNTGANGGSGTIYLRYAGTSALGTYTGTQTVTIGGGFVTHQFLTSGVYTA